MKEIKPLVQPKWQPVIPIEYTESLSQYETICKILYKLNEVISVVNLDLTDDLMEYLQEHLDEIMLDVMYDADTRTITLKIKESEEK